VALSEDLERIVQAALPMAGPGERLAAVIPSEPTPGLRVYLCAFEQEAGRSWVALDGDGRPVRDRRLIREAVSIAAMCELAEEQAGGRDLVALRARLAELRQQEDLEGVEAAEAAAEALQEAILPPPRVASPAYLDRIGGAARKLEQALGEIGRSPFAEAMAQGTAAVEALAADVEVGYKLDLH
jgi:hypothetical protein